MESLQRAEKINAINAKLPISTLTVDTIQTLPLISRYLANKNEPLLLGLIEEQTKILQLDTINKNISSFEDEHEISFYKYVKECKLELETYIAHVTKLVEKHYRKTAAKIHPDRRGEEYRPMFEMLTDAKDILKDETLRHSYISQMGQVLSAFGDALLESSHDAWINKNRPDMAENLVRVVQQSKVQRLEGGLLYQALRMPRVNIIDSKSKKVKVSLPVLRPEYEFFDHLQEVEITFESTELQVDSYNRRNVKHVHKRTKGELLTLHDGKENALLSNGHLNLGEEIILPGHGYWDVSWNCTLSDSMKTYVTSQSMDMSFSIIDKKMRERLLRCGEIEEKTIRTTRNLDAASKKLRGARPSDQTKIFHDFHSIVVKARSLLRQLESLLKVTHQASKIESTSSPYAQLKQALDASKDKLIELQTYRQSLIKKGALKKFKCYVAIILESGDAYSWLNDIQEEELESHGGNANRLYQLFVEGKGNFVLQLEAEMLEEASKRSDLFSQRQCNDFLYRSKQMVEKDKKEEERIKAAEIKKKMEEGERVRILLEIKRAWIGTHVLFQALTSAGAEKYNGKLGLVVDYLPNEDRYKVQYRGGLNDEWQAPDESKAFAVKPENLRKYYGYVPTPKSPETSIQSSKSEDEEDGESNDLSKDTEDFPSPKQRSSVGSKSTNKDDLTQNGIPNLGLQTKQPRNDLTQNGIPNSYLQTKQPRNDLTQNGIPNSGLQTKQSQKKSNESPRNKVKSGSSVIEKPSSKENSTPSLFLSVKSTTLGRNSKAFQPSTGAKLCQYGKNCRFQMTKSCNLFHPEVARYAIIEEDVVNIIFGQGKVRIEDIMSISGAWVGIRELKSRKGSTLEFAGTQKEVNEAITLIEQCMRTGMSVQPTVSCEEHENNSIPTSVHVSQQSSPAKLTGSVCTPSTNADNTLLEFLQAHHHCIKGSPGSFHDWLVQSEDINTLDDLAEAVSDADYIKECLQPGNGVDGVKGFKRKAFQSAVLLLSKSS